MLRLFCWALTFGLIVASPSARGAEPYPLGVALGLTGTGAPYSREALNGVRLAVEEINAEGGMLGAHPIEVFVENTRTEPDVAERVARRLIDENGVKAIIGTYSSGTALAIKPICRENEVLHIATISNAEDITKIDPSPYTFSVVPNTYMMAKAVALRVAELAKEKGWKRYVTVASNYAWGRSQQQVTVDMLREIAPELELVNSYWPPLGYVSFNTVVVSVANDDPDFVLESIAGTDKERWDAALRDYRSHGDIPNPGSLISLTELISEASWIERGTLARTRAPFFAHMDNPRMVSFVETYWSTFGRYPSDWAVMTYDGVMALKQGIEAAGSIEPQVVKDALSGATIDTLRGRLFFRQIDNQLSASAYVGTVADDPLYDFPIYIPYHQYYGPEIWRPEEQIRAAREEQ